VSKRAKDQRNAQAYGNKAMTKEGAVAVTDFTLNPPRAEDMQAYVSEWLRLSGKAQQMVSEWALKQGASGGQTLNLDPLGLSSTWLELWGKMAADPAKMFQLQASYLQDAARLMQQFAIGAAGEKAEPVIEPKSGDKRFASAEWRDNQIFDFFKQSYLLAAKYTQETVHDIEGLDPKTKAKAEFYTRQFVDAMSPSNFVLTNPDVLKATVEQKGQNLLRGLEHMLEDMERGGIAMTDFKAFEVGKNVAVTPGAVVFENRFFQLIHYAPTTEQVYETPILFFPPWINKFYILDLTAEKSMVRWLTEQGFSVFMVSWINPDASFATTTIDEYMLEGQLKALEVVRDICGVKSAHVIGYCVAGSLLAGALSYLHAKKRQGEIKTATFFTAQIDFSEAGELCVFIDDPQLDALRKLMEEKGYLDSSYMQTTFNLLRSNDLIWSFVVNNYLMGKDPFPFDLLYWNCDSTRLPRDMHLYYLKNFYQENRLIQKGGITLDGVPVDLTTVKTPTYIQAGKEDHIAPVRSVWKMTQAFKGPMVFRLAGSGHIAGVVNPPAAKKYQYWVNDAPFTTYDDYVAGAVEHKGSWWPDWVKWLAPQSGKKVAARVPGAAKGYPAIEPAPGRYVKAK
jgi:polyhydroxyalkanoate synthase subunit PhaC